MHSIQLLANALYTYGKWIHRCWTSLPTQVDYPISDTINYGNIFIPIGVTRKGTQYLKIGGEQAHTYIVGQTGSGKSNLTKVILSSLVNNYPTSNLILLDYKRVELALFKNTKNCIQFEWDERCISQALEDLLTLVLQRYEILEMQGKTEADYTMSNIVCVIEEISLMPKNDMKVLRKLMAISRAVHIYIIFTTQRPSNECLDNVVKSLVGNRICLKTDDTKNSILSLDKEGCELLKGKGHGYLKSSGIISEFQAYSIKQEVIDEIVSKHISNRKNVTVSSDSKDSYEKIVTYRKNLTISSNSQGSYGKIVTASKIITPPNDIAIPPQLIYTDNQINTDIIINDITDSNSNNNWLDQL